jgi:hypothetical protein
LLTDKLAALGATPYGPGCGPAFEQKLGEFELLIEARLPDDYRTVLGHYNGAAIRFDRQIQYRPLVRSPWDRPDGTGSVELLFGLCSERDCLEESYHNYYGRVEENLIAIGRSPGGNLICIGTRGVLAGKVYFWDHEAEIPGFGGASPGVRNTYLIAESFESLIGSLEIEPDAPPVDLGNVKVWLADDLLE